MSLRRSPDGEPPVVAVRTVDGRVEIRRALQAFTGPLLIDQGNRQPQRTGGDDHRG